jgi:Tol biopolymer transport system component
MRNALMLLSLTVLVFALLLVSAASAGSYTAQANPTEVQQTLDASVGGLFTQTAQAQGQMVMTGTVQALFDQALTATAAAPTAAPSLGTAEPVTGASILHEIDLLAGPGLTGAYFAPDGEHFAYLNRDEGICIYTIMGEQERCTPILDQMQNIEPESIYWSSDSRYLIMSEEIFRSLVDPDIWMIDTTTGELTNLTDDEAIGRLEFDNEDWPPIDIAPRWFNDGQQIAFLRYDKGEQAMNVASLMTMSPDGSELVISRQLDGIDTFGINIFDMSPDGSQIAYNIFSKEEGQSGLWLSSIDGDDGRQVAPMEGGLAPLSITFSPDGHSVLAITTFLMTRVEPEPEFSPVRIVSLDDGEIRLLDENHPVISAAWSPDGSMLAYLVRDQLSPDESGLYVTSGLGEDSTLVLQGRFAPPTNQWRQPLMWATNNTILLSRQPEPGIVIVQLETD